MDRAKKCYQKSLSLGTFPNCSQYTDLKIDQLDEEAGQRLSDIYISQNQQTLAVAIYREVTSRSNRIKWAWLRLALHQLV